MKSSTILATLLLLACGAALAQTGTGLTGKYYDTETFGTLKTTRTDASINFNFGTAIPSGTAITAATTYSIAWSGQIEPQYSELYTFTVTADDGARLWVDDQMIVGRTFYQSPGELRGQIRLKAGHRVNLRLEYIQQTGNASVKLEWTSASQTKQVVPTNRLYTTTEVPNGGAVMREVWTGIPGASIASLTSNANYPNKPASREFITSFECITQNWEDSFGTRVTGFIRAPLSGSYTFAVSGDDVVELYLSTDATVANKTLIASVASATAYRQWDAQPSQQSAARTLVAGQRYYVELLHKEDAGTDHWSVGWKQPGDTAFSVVPGTVLMQPGVDTAQPATANFFDTLCTEQPRLGVSRERFLWLKQMYQSPNSSNAKSRAQAVINSANNDLTAALQIQRAARDMIQRLALAWWLTDDSRYAEAAWNQINNSINNGDWADPWKGVEDGVVAVGYDWLYPYWSQARRTAMTNCMVNKGFSTGWTDSYSNNIGVIINAGHLEAMLAVGLVNESAAEGKIGSAISRLNTKVDKWNANSGAWYEGTDYGIFTKWGFGQAMPAMEMALGSTFGLSKIVGISATAKEPLTIASNTRQRFTFSDVGTGSEAAIGWANWFARRYNALETFDYSRQAGNSPLNALTLPETTLSPAITGINPDAAYRGPADASGGDFLGAVTMRQNWTDTKATFVGGLGGTYESHGHLQSGSFQLAARGVKWFVDLSSEDYSVTNHNTTTPNPNGIDRWDYYRWRAEGHNCLIINSTAGPDRIWNAPPAPLLNYQSAQNGQRSFAIWDMSANISGVTKVQRGIQLLNHRKEVLVQDEIVTPTASTAWWYAHFVNSSTSTAISPDGTSVMLTSGSERLWGKIVSGGGTWTIRPASALIQTNNPPVADTPNTGKSKLAINLTGVTNTTLAVWFVPLAPGEAAPTILPAITPLSSWNLVADNEAPVASNTNAESTPGAAVDVNLSASTTDDWTPSSRLTYAVASPVGGTVALLPDGFTARFTPTAGFTGTQSFTYTATDADGATSNVGTSTFSVPVVVNNWTSTTSGNWSTGTNWQSGAAPTSSPGSDIRFFSGQTLASGTLTATNNLTGTTALNQLTLAGTGTATTVVNLAGNPLSFAANGITQPVVTLSGSTSGFTYQVANDITLGQTTTINVSGSGTFIFNGAISGAGGITRTSSIGTLILAGNNSYAGATTINAGTLQIGNDGTTGTLGSGPVTVLSGATLRIDRTGSVVISNDITGDGRLIVNGVSSADVVSLTGNNDFTGEVRVDNGSLRITDPRVLGSGTKNIIAVSATALLRLDGTSAPVVLPSEFSVVTSNPNGALLNEAGDNEILGNVTLSSGAGSSRFTVAGGSLMIDGTLTANASGRGLDLCGAGLGIINGDFIDGTGANTVAGFTKNDAGTWTLNGNNSISCTTVISGGKLVINGSHTSGTVSVASGATLAGCGSVTAATTVNGILAPGDGVGTMNFANTLSFGSTSSVQWEIGSNSLVADQVVSAAGISVTSGAKIDVVLDSPGSETTYILSFWRTTRTWPLVSGSSLTGAFSLGTVSGDAAGFATATYGSFSLQHTATGVNLIWTPIAGFPLIDEPQVTITSPSTSLASLPDAGSSMRLTATAAGGGTINYVWSLLVEEGDLGGTVTFANPNLPDTRVSFSEPGIYTLKCTATNEAVSRSSTLVIFVGQPASLALQQDLDGYSHRASYIQSNSTAWNHGADPQMRVGKNSGSHRAVLGFDLNDLPPGAIIRSAKLDLWTDLTVGVGTISPLELHRLTCGFKEGTGDGSSASIGAGSGVTWASTNGATAAGDLWNPAGGSSDSAILANIAGYDTTLTGVPRSFASSQAFVAAAQAALDGNQSLDLILLSPATENGTSNAYTNLKSNEHPDAQQRPLLTLDYTLNSLPQINPGTTIGGGVGFPLPLNGSVVFANSSQWSLVSGPGTAAFTNPASPVTTVTFSTAGSYLLRLSASNAYGEASRDLAVSVGALPDGFAAWQSANWPGVSNVAIIGPNADPDGDGVTNAIEFNAGTNPTTSTSVPAFIWNRSAPGDWNSAGCWQLGAVPPSNAVTRLEFFTGLVSDSVIAANNNIGGSFNLKSLALNGSGSGSTSITGGTLAFSTGGTLDLNSDGLAYQIASPVALNAATAVGGSSDDTLQINGVVSGAGTLTKSGPFTLSLAANNTMTGSEVLDGGAVRYTADQTTALAGITFGASNGSANVTALTIGSLAANALTARTSANSANAISIGAGKTLTINGAVDISTTANNGTAGARVTFNPSGAVANSTFRATGTGSFIVGKNNVTQSATRNTNLDMRNLATLNAGSTTTALASFQVGYYTGQVGNYEDYGINTVYLAPASIIYATSFGVGDVNQPGQVGGQTQSTLYLGSGANQIHATTITIGEAQDISATGSGTMKWNSGVTTGSLAFAGIGATAAVTSMYVGAKSDTGSTYDHTGTVDLTNGTVTGSITNLYVGFQTSNGGSSNPQTFGTFRIGGGTGGASNLTIGSLYLGDQSAIDTAHTTSGTFEIDGGSVSVTNNIELTHTAGGIATLNILGGTLTVGGKITSLGGTETLTLDGGTLDMTDGEIGNATNPISALTFASGTLKNVGSINGNAGFTKTGSGTLTLDGLNNFTGNLTGSTGSVTLADNARFRFAVGASSSNKITGAGSVTLNGDFYLDLANAAPVIGKTWTLVDVTNRTYGPTFTVTSSIGDFANNAGVWTRAESNDSGIRVWTFTQATGVLSIAAVDPSSYASWIAAYPGFSDTSPSGDPDGDGIANLLEYVLKGGDPSSPDRSILPTPDASGANFIFTFTRRAASVANSTQVFQYGSDLVKWTDVPVVPGGRVAILENTPSAGLQQVSVTIPKASSNRILGRLKVSMP